MSETQTTTSGEWYAACHDCDRSMWYPDQESAEDAAKGHEDEYGHDAYADTRETPR